MRAMKDPTEAPVLGDVSLIDVATAAGCPTPAYLLEAAEKVGLKVAVLETWDGHAGVSREDAKRLREAVGGFLQGHLDKNQRYNRYREELERKATEERRERFEKERAEWQERNRHLSEQARQESAARAAAALADQEAARVATAGNPVPFERFDPSKVA